MQKDHGDLYKFYITLIEIQYSIAGIFTWRTSRENSKTNKTSHINKRILLCRMISGKSQVVKDKYNTYTIT